MSDKNDIISPPRLLAGNKNLQQIAVTTSHQNILVDAVLRNRCVRIKTEVACAFFFSSVNTGEVDYTLATSVGPTSATLGYRMAAGTWEDFNLGGSDNYLCVEGGAAGIMQLQGSSNPRTGTETP